MRKVRLLSASDDLPLLATRNQILTRPGYDVIAASIDEVLSLAGNADGVLLGYSIPLEKRASVAIQLRHRFPGIPIIVIHHSNEEAGAEFATVSVNCLDGPQALLDLLEQTFPIQQKVG